MNRGSPAIRRRGTRRPGKRCTKRASSSRRSYSPGRAPIASLNPVDPGRSTSDTSSSNFKTPPRNEKSSSRQSASRRHASRTSRSQTSCRELEVAPAHGLTDLQASLGHELSEKEQEFHEIAELAASPPGPLPFSHSRARRRSRRNPQSAGSPGLSAAPSSQVLAEALQISNMKDRTAQLRHEVLFAPELGAGRCRQRSHSHAEHPLCGGR